MAKLVLTDATVHVDGYDFTSDLNSVDLNTEAEAKECTTFGSGGWRERLGGLKSVSLSEQGFWSGDGPDADVFPNLGANRTAVTVSPEGSDGATAFLFQSLDNSYNLLGAVGDVAPFTLEAMGRGATRRGNLLLPSQSLSGDTDGNGVQMGAVASGESVYTAIHVFTAGTTATVNVESDDNGSFSSPTTQSSTVVTGVGGTWVAAVAGPITDDYWRVTVDTVTGTFILAASVAIA